MAASGPDDVFAYDKPGAERSRRRRGEDDDLESDLEGDLLDDDWLSSKKNPSELSDEELNDDLLQSDEEDQNTSAQGEALSLNATLGLSASYDLQEGEEEFGGEYAGEGYEAAEGEFPQEEEYRADEYGDGGEMEYSTENNQVYEDEVLDLQIDEPLDDEFQEEQIDQQEVPEAEEQEPEEVEDQEGSQVTESEELEPEPEQETDTKEESDEDEDEEESGRLRFKTERKDVTVIRLSEAASKRRNIPETLELTEEAKADLLEFEERERLRKQGRFRGRGRGGGRGGLVGDRGRGGRGNLPLFGMSDFRGNGGPGRGRMHEQMPPLMQMNLGMQSRMVPPQSHLHPSRTPGQRGGPGLFPNPMSPLTQQPLQLLLPHRSPGPPNRPQLDLHRPPTHTHSQTHSNQQQQQQQPKNIHINPHFRGPSSSPVPLVSPAQNQPRPNLSPQRFPGPVDFQPHLQGNFVQPQRPPPPQDQWRGPPPSHQEREPFFNNEPRFPGQHLFDLPGPAPLMNNNVLPLAFPQPGGPGGPVGPGFGPLGMGQGQGPPGPAGLFQREPLRPNPQQSGPSGPPGPRGFIGHRQPFSHQQGPPFNPQHMAFGIQGLMPPHSQPQHHDPPPSHHPLHHQQQQQQHRQDLPPHGHLQAHPPPPHHHNQHQQQHEPHQQHLHHQRQPGEQHPIMNLSHSPFRQPLQGGPRAPQQRSQNGQQRNNLGRMRMASPSSLQQLQSPQRNSNLRELPIAPGNIATRPPTPASQMRPVTRATQEMKPEVRPGQGVAVGAVGRGRGGVTKAATPSAPAETSKQAPPTQPSTSVQDPDEDEETRLYRLKIEEQKRLREEILKRKELRRQMQAGVRKKELLERIGNQNQTQTQPQTQTALTHPSSEPQTPPLPIQPIPTLLAPNGPPQVPTVPRAPNVKARLQSSCLEPGTSKPQPIPQLQLQKKAPAQQNPLRQFPNPVADPQAQALRPGAKRTVMQRTNSAGAPLVPQKVRLVKRLSGGDADPHTGAPPTSLHPHQPPPQPGRPAPQQRMGTARKVTVTTGGAQPPQEPGAGPANRVVVSGRGRGRGGPLAGRGGGAAGGGGGGGGGGGKTTLQQNRTNLRTTESQKSTVSIEGLSTTTTEKQIKNLLNSIGPIQMFKMLPGQRKAIAKFVNPQHALSFQHSFHRHMIDLSHIDVTIIEG